MSARYDKAYALAKKMITKFGTTMKITSLDGLGIYDGIIVYLRPDRKRDDMALDKMYLTNSNQRRAYFQLLVRGIFEPERGCIITSGDKSMTIDTLRAIAPANKTVVYECLLEV
jgi:hypothetical protein